MNKPTHRNKTSLTEMLIEEFLKPSKLTLSDINITENELEDINDKLIEKLTDYFQNSTQFWNNLR